MLSPQCAIPTVPFPLCPSHCALPTIFASPLRHLHSALPNVPFPLCPPNLPTIQPYHFRHYALPIRSSPLCPPQCALPIMPYLLCPTHYALTNMPSPLVGGHSGEGIIVSAFTTFYLLRQIKIFIGKNRPSLLLHISMGENSVYFSNNLVIQRVAPLNIVRKQ
jgi:hypothetical protein